jgi:PKD repeat protein
VRSGNSIWEKKVASKIFASSFSFRHVSVALIIALLVASTVLMAMPQAAAQSSLSITSPPAGTSGNVGDVVFVAGRSDTSYGLVQVYWDSITSWDGAVGLLAEANSVRIYYNITIVIPETTNGTHNIIVRDVTENYSTEVTFQVQPKLTLTPNRGFPGETITARGNGFAAALPISLTLESTTLVPDVFFILTTSPDNVVTTNRGSFEANFTIISADGFQPDSYTVAAIDPNSYLIVDVPIDVEVPDTFHWPVADFTYSPTSPVAGEEVFFDASGSVDPDGNLTSYFWDIRRGLNASLIDSSLNASPVFSYSFPEPDVYDVALVVTDDNSLTNSIMRQITVIQEFALTIQVDGSGSTDLGVGVHSFEEGSIVNATAYPSDGWMLNCWLLNGQNVSANNTFTGVLIADSSLTAVFTEIPSEPFPPAYLLALVGGGAGAAGLGYYAYRRVHPKPDKDAGKDAKKSGDENKKQRRRRKKARLELMLVEPARTVTGGMASNVKLRIKNVGPDLVADVHCSVLSSYGLNLENKLEKIPLIHPDESVVRFFRFAVSRNVNRGEYKLRFTAEGDHAQTVVKTFTVRAIRIGLLTDPRKRQQLMHYRKWLSSNSLAWDELHNADNVMRLLSYDVVLVAPALELPAKWSRVLRSFVDNDRVLLKPRTDDSVEGKISEKILALLKNDVGGTI